MRTPSIPILLLSMAIVYALPVWAEQTEDVQDSAVTEGNLGASLNSSARTLVKAFSLIGTPYKFGSSKPEQGVDCSGFVRHVYKETGAATLPRSAQDMSKQGAEVVESELKPGDLVFFNTRKKPFSHVGIYAGNGEFVHASSGAQKQVTVSRMADRYWSSRFNGARRVLSTP